MRGFENEADPPRGQQSEIYKLPLAMFNFRAEFFQASLDEMIVLAR